MSDLASRITKPGEVAQTDAPAPAVAPANLDGAGDSLQEQGLGLQDSSFDVEVKLSELQADTDHPLSSNISSFQELNLYA